MDSVTIGGAKFRDKLAAMAMDMPDFRDELDRAAREIREAATATATEATVEGHFESVLYATLREIGIRFTPEKETHVDYRRHVGHGRMDSRIGAVVIEYKRPSRLRTDAQRNEAFGQLEEYVVAIDHATNSEVRGFLTDGRVIAELRSHDGSVIRSPFVKLAGDSLMRLTKTIVSLRLTALRTENLIRDFCGPAGDGALFALARTLEDALREEATPKTEMLRSEWEQLFRLAHEDQSQQQRIADRRAALAEVFSITIEDAAGEYRALFALHTAYAIVLKFMAYRVTSELQFGSTPQNFDDLTRGGSTQLRGFCSRLEDGELFRALGVVNLLEGDFFSWYADRRQWNADIAAAVRRVVELLALYEDAKGVFASDGAMDLFRGLYEAVVPRVVRIVSESSTRHLG